MNEKSNDLNVGKENRISSENGYKKAGFLS